MTMSIRQIGLPTVQQLSGRLGLPTIQQLSDAAPTAVVFSQSGNPLDALSSGEKILDFAAVAAGLVSIGAGVMGHKEIAHGTAWAALFGGMAVIAMTARRAIMTHSLVQQAGGDPGAMIASINASNAGAFVDSLFGGGALASSALGFFFAGQ